MKGWCRLQGEIKGGDWSSARLRAHGGVQGPGRTSLEPTRLEARGKAQQDKERHRERFASREASRRLQSPAKATPGLMQQQRVTPGSQRSQRGHHPPSPMAGVPRHRRDAQPSHLDHILFG